MKYKMRIAYFIWIVIILFAVMFDEIIDFSIPFSSIALALMGVIFYLVTHSEVKKGDVDISDLSENQKAIYESYVKIDQDELDQRDIYIRNKVNLKALMILVVFPALLVFLELILNYIKK